MSRRSGFLTYLLLGAMVVVGILVFALENYARQQNRFAHRIAYGQACESMARSGLTVLSTRFRETFRRSGKLLPLLTALGNTKFSFFIASRPEQITRRFASLGSSSDAIFRQLVGPDYRFPLDQMVERYPGATVELSIAIVGKPLYEAAGVVDPVEKSCTLTLTARAAWLGVTRRVSTGYEIKVVHPAPPLAAKFTLFAGDASGNWNSVSNDRDGEPAAGSPRPALVFNTPPEDRLAGLDDRSLIARKADAGTVRAALTNRGHIFLGSPGGLSLNLTAGREGLGEFFHLYDPLRVASGKLYTKLFAPPAFFNSWLGDHFDRKTRTENATHLQWPNLQHVHYGFDESIKGDPVLGESLPDEGRSSLLHLFGTAQAPSRTAVWGEVQQAVCKVARIGFETQGKAVPDPVPYAPRPGYDGVPYLPYCPSNDAFLADLASESAGGDPKHLVKIRRHFTSVHGELPLESAPAVEAMCVLDQGTYTHARMFNSTYSAGTVSGPSAGYAGFMSKVERYAFAEMADAMQYPNFFPPSSGAADTFVSVLDRPYTAYREAKNVELRYNDDLHRQLNQGTYYQGNFRDMLVAKPNEVSPAEQILRARTLREFGTQNELFDACEFPRGSKRLEIWEPVRVLEGNVNLSGCRVRGMGQIVVDKGDLVAPNGPELMITDGFPSLITYATLAGDVRLTGGGQHHGYFLAAGGTVRVEGSGEATVVGGLAAQRLGPGELGSGLVVQYMSHADPTRSDDSQAARFVDYYTVAMGNLPIAVERL